MPERFFCWAPFDIHTRYEIVVEIGGRELTRAEIRNRYKYEPVAWEPRSIHNVFSIIEQFESTYGVADEARVTVDYSVNGHPSERWTWPQT